VLISIITPSYNSESTIGDTLQSVFEQSYPFVEHILIDGNSKDSTRQIVQGFPHVNHFLSENDNGVYHAMNKGICLAKGDIIGILNSDDFYSNKDVLQQVADVFSKTGCDAMYADLEYVRRSDKSKVVRRWVSGSYQDKAFAWGWMPPHPTFFVRREMYKKYGLFNLTLKSSADYELMLRFIHVNKICIAYLPKVIVNMRDGGMSNKSLLNRLRGNKEDKLAWKLNGISPGCLTLLLKPIRKIPQFL
jgi:glycosyltransferase